MDQYLDEIIEYAHKLIISGAEFKSPEEIASIEQLTKQKYIEILKRDGYSEQLSNVIFDNSKLWYIIYGYHRKNPDEFRILNLLKIHVKKEIKFIITNLFILRLSLLYEPTKPKEKIYTEYLVKEGHSPEEIERLLPFFIYRLSGFPNDEDQRMRSLDQDFKITFERRVQNLNDFIKTNKIGNLISIYILTDKLIRIVDEIINPDELEQTVKEYLNEIEVPEIILPSIIEKIYEFKKFHKDRLERVDGIPRVARPLSHPNLLPEMINMISGKINYEIHCFKINQFLDTIEPTEENIQLFINKNKISREQFNEIINSIFDKKIGLFIKENYYFTVSSVNEFLLANKGLSREQFESILNSYKQFSDPSIIIYPDPNIKPETGESLSSSGRVLPNCALCCNILNINIPKDSKFRIGKLPCGGLFHIKCISDFHKTHGKICPVCGENS
jgi:hypothetical protein